jgi:hypothetical protein
MNLGFAFSNRKILSIVFLLLCIFISLSLSNIPFLVNNTMPVKEVTLEGMDNSDSQTVVENILNDKIVTSNKKKLTAIEGIIPFIEDKEIRTKFNTILNNRKMSDSKKIEKIKSIDFEK